MSMYLCYDLKGIQQYIFQVPKLKCCIGGSRQIDEFDRREAVAIQVPSCRLIYSGGGKGAFACDDEATMQKAKEALRDKALAKGLTIRFGFDSDYTKAAREIRETYVYQPESLEGHPCQLSGLYPTTEPGGIHPLLKARQDKGGEHGMESDVEKEFLEYLCKECGKEKLQFFYDVNAKDSRLGAAGARALGGRNRWAVVCMDGNDMGKQFLAFKKQSPGETEWGDWLPNMSKSLDECTRKAAKAGMLAVVKRYLESYKESGEVITLPLRPLIVGGDDVTVLVGCDYALEFVETVMKAFEEASKICSKLWVGTGGRLTISAGILYAPVSLPLHSALAYAESLLASAKTHGRDLNKKTGNAEGKASPACLDWESVTEGVLDSPGARRRRELMYKDAETGRCVELTERPYSLEEFKSVVELEKELSDLPRKIQYEIHPALYGDLAHRLAFYARIGKNHPDLERLLLEPVPGVGGEYGGGWTVSESKQTTKVLDALNLLQEEHRMKNPTLNQEEA